MNSKRKREEIKLKNMLKNLTSDLCPDSLLTKSPWARISRWKILLSRPPEDKRVELQAKAPTRNRWPSIVLTFLQRDASQSYIEGCWTHKLNMAGSTFYAKHLRITQDNRKNLTWTVMVRIHCTLWSRKKQMKKKMTALVSWLSRITEKSRPKKLPEGAWYSWWPCWCQWINLEEVTQLKAPTYSCKF